MTVAWSPLGVDVATVPRDSVAECGVTAGGVTAGGNDTGTTAFSLTLPRVAAELPGTTILASLRARSIFFARELRHCVRRHDPEHPFRVLELGGDGRELAEFLLASRGYAWVDAALVSSDVSPLGCAAQYVFRIEEGVRYVIDARSPLAMLHAPDRTAPHDRDLIYVPTLLDFISDRDASAVLDRVLEHLRPGGIMVAATFDDGIPSAEVQRIGEVVGRRPHPRSARELEDLRRRSELACHESARVLDRGPNRYLFLRRRPAS